jgi:primosomal protein N'
MAPFDVDPPTPEEAAEIKRRKAAITRRVRKEVLAELAIDRLPKEGERTLVTGAQGTGKSTACAEAIAELPARDLAIWWLVPSLEKADEQAGDYNGRRNASSLPGRVVRGRGALDPGIDDAMCPRHLVVNRMHS